MSALWTVAEIARAVNGKVEGAGARDELPVSSLSIDTRTLDEGALYVAIKGVRLDGHQFVPGAFAAGASAALVCQSYEASTHDGVLIRVADTLEALGALGVAARARAENAKIIAVTGSAGKTGTKAALADMLAQSGHTHSSVKSFNNHWGVPLSLARMARESAYGVFEVGMNHAGEISPLSRMIRPHAALITTVAPVHIGHFENEAAIADAKAEIFAGLTSDGAAVLPADNLHFEQLKARAQAAGAAQILSFGAAPGADARLIAGDFGPEGSRVEAVILGEAVSFTLNIPGRHIALNLIGALLALKLVGGDLGRAVAAIPNLSAPEGRGVKQQFTLPGGSLLLIDESYNANPASMRAALEMLGQYKGDGQQRRVAVLGDMLELGALSRGYHEAVAGEIETLDIDQVFACGEMMAHMFAKLSPAKQGDYAATSEALVESVEKNLRACDVVMVKGSLGSDMGRIVDNIRARYKVDAG